MIAMYDLDDNLIRIFDNYKECAEYFRTTTNTIRSCMCRYKKGQRSKKRDGNKWVKLYMIEDE